MKTFAWLCVTGVGVALAAPALAGMAFQDLGDFSPTDVSADGMVVAGTIGASAGRWTEAGGLQNIGGEGGSVSISADGLVIAGNVLDKTGLRTAGYWVESLGDGDGWTSIGSIPGAVPCDGSLSSAYGISGDGDVIVGLGWLPELCKAHGFRWEESTGMVDMGSTVPDRATRANAISDDTQVIVGWQDGPTGFRQGAMWDDTLSQTLFVSDTGNPVGEAQNTNTDGSIVVGGSVGVDAWRWQATDDGGAVVEAIGSLPGFNFRAIATDLSEDGTVVVGFAGFGGDRDAFIYIEGDGMRKLDDYLVELGILDAQGWDLFTPTGCSADGNVIVGWGQAPSPPFFRGWRIDLNTGSTPVELSAFNAVVVDEGVQLDWRVHTASDTRGFHVLRQEGDGERLELTNELIELTSERSYSFTDATAEVGHTYDYTLRAEDADGSFELHGPQRVTVVRRAPARVVLHEARPNPFNPSTSIGFELAEAGLVTLQVYDGAGRLVRTLVDGALEAAAHDVQWDGLNDEGQAATSGIYIYRLHAGGEVLSRKMTLLK